MPDERDDPSQQGPAEHEIEEENRERRQVAAETATIVGAKQIPPNLLDIGFCFHLVGRGAPGAGDAIRRTSRQRGGRAGPRRVRI